MPAAARRKPSARAKRPAPPQAWRDRLPTLEQRHWDLIGLGLVALAIFLAFLVYLGWDGGRAERRSWTACETCSAPSTTSSLSSSWRRASSSSCAPSSRPCGRSGRRPSACSATTLGLAAGTLGIGSGGRQDRGGLVGEALYELTSTLLGTVGSHIVALFCLVAGVLLLTGASIASVVQATGDSVSLTGRRLRDGSTDARTAVARRRSAREELQALEASEQPTAVLHGDECRMRPGGRPGGGGAAGRRTRPVERPPDSGPTSCPTSGRVRPVPGSL